MNMAYEHTAGPAARASGITLVNPTEAPDAHEVRVWAGPDAHQTRHKEDVTDIDTWYSGKEAIETPSGSGWQGELLARARALTDVSKAVLAEAWGVSTSTLDLLDVGFYGHSYSLPMRDAAGEVVGFQFRPVTDSGTKLNEKGSRMGLFLPRGIRPDRVQIVTEGASDLATVLDLRFGAVGRASAQSPTKWLCGFLRQATMPHPCIIGDNDAAGRAGAKALADELIAEGIVCRLLFPPAEFKDVRQWRMEGGLTTQGLAAEIRGSEPHYPPDEAKGFLMIDNAAFRRGLVKRLGAIPTLVLLAIASHQNKDGLAWVTVQQLSEETGLKKRSIDRAKAAAKALGLLTWQKGRQHKANMYKLNLPPVRGARKQPPVNPIL
jgi:hypothetical protein